MRGQRISRSKKTFCISLLDELEDAIEKRELAIKMCETFGEDREGQNQRRLQHYENDVREYRRKIVELIAGG